MLFRELAYQWAGPLEMTAYFICQNLIINLKRLFFKTFSVVFLKFFKSYNYHMEKYNA